MCGAGACSMGPGKEEPTLFHPIEHDLRRPRAHEHKIGQPRRPHGRERRQHRPHALPRQHAPERARQRVVARVRRRQRDGERGLQGEVDGEERGLEGAEGRAVERAVAGGADEEGLVDLRAEEGAVAARRVRLGALRQLDRGGLREEVVGCGVREEAEPDGGHLDGRTADLVAEFPPKF